MSKAWIDGAAAPLSEAVSAAAGLIAASRFPIVTGLVTDVAGIKGGLSLAIACRGAIDHGHSQSLYKVLEVLRSNGSFVAAPAEMRRRADLFLVVGGDVLDVSPELLAFVFGGVRDLGRATGDAGSRKIVWLGAQRSAALPANGIEVEAIECADSDLADALAMIRAAASGRRFGPGPISAETAHATAQGLKGAAFGCALWSAHALSATGVQMVAGLVADLNAETRFSSIMLHRAGQAFGAAQVATFTSGYPLRTSFAGGTAEHDPWRFETLRLVASGETDLAVYVSALAGVEPVEPSFAGDVATIAIVGGEPFWTNTPRVAFSVAVAGADSGGVIWKDEAASFVPIEASGSADEHADIGAGELLEAIAAELGSLLVKTERAA